MLKSIADFHPRQRSVAVQQHEHPAAHSARDAAGAANVHLTRVERHPLGEGQRFLEVCDVAPLDLFSAHDRDAHGGLAGTHHGAARGDGHAGNVEEERLEEDAERLGAGAGGVDRQFGARVAVGHHRQRVRPGTRDGDLEGSVHSGQSAQRRRLDEDLRAHDGRPSLFVHDVAADGRPLLGGQGEGGEVRSQGE